jgi:integrase
MLKTLALSASVLAFAGGLALAETTITREPSTGRSVVTNPSSSLSTDQWLAPTSFVLLVPREVPWAISNPARGVETHRGEAKERVLSPGELARLGAALRKGEALRPAAVAALRLLTLTGLRREEACGLRWREIDWASGCLRLEMTKTGRSIRPIGKVAPELLSTLPRRGEWVFSNRDGSGRADLKSRIAALFDEGGLTDARSHDLRRKFGSLAADEGYGGATIAELLGHARRGMTARHYIRRPDTALITAADRVAQRIADALDGRKNAQIIELRQSVRETA